MRSALALAILLLFYVSLIAGFMWLEAAVYGPPQKLPLIQADFQRCVTVNPGVLKPRKPTIYPRNHPEIS